MKLLIIFTGGTIGSSVKDGYISVDRDNIKKLLDAVLNCGGGGETESERDNNGNADTGSIDIEVVNPYTILSETLDGTHIAALVKCINENIKAYDGIIVCHGTDTLQYTAVALGFAFSDCEVPIVIVSSNYVLDDPRTNGPANLKTAVEFIIGRSKVAGLANRMRRGGVWVSYKNENELRAQLYEPFELLPHQAYDDSLYVISAGTHTEAGCAHFPADEAINEATLTWDSRAMNEACLKLEKKSGVLWIKAYPGMSYTGYIWCDKEKPRCILLDSFHSGTINTSDRGLLELTQWAKENDIPVYLIGLEPGVSYETTRVYAGLGINVLPKMSPVTAYMWSWLRQSQSK